MRLSAQLYFVLITAFAVSAQSIRLNGIISNQSGKPIAGALVTLKGRQLADTSDANGAYLITNAMVAANGIPFMARTQRISLANGNVLISLAKPDPLKIEMLDSKGHLLEKTLEYCASAGDYRIDLKRKPIAPQIVIIRVSIGQRARIFRYLQFNGIECSNVSFIAELSTNERLTKVKAAIDSLQASAFGYSDKTVAISSYEDTVNITLDTLQLFGAFLVLLKGDIDDNPPVTTVIGRINDGPSPQEIIYEKRDAIGNCVLYQSRIPFCPEDCGSAAVCVENDSCQPYPSWIDAGIVTGTGFKINSEKKTFTMECISGSYQSPILDFPPCAEGDSISFSAAGSGTISAFTVGARGISPLEILNDTFPCAEGQDINVRWVKPIIQGISTIYVFIDISYHGGSKGKIECNCEDNSSLTVAAALLDKLKTYGISGWPKIEIYRRSIGINAMAKTKIIIESKAVRFLSIPGIISCSDDSQCPDGQTCGGDQRCH